MMPPRLDPRLDHQPYYCEENIYRLAASGRVAHASEVVFITNGNRQVACWDQRPCDPGKPIVWDYHVVLLEHHPEGARIWDLDCVLGCPIPAQAWLDTTFRDPSEVLERYQPRFRVVPSAVFLAEFATDRSHMRSPAGDYYQPPPPWVPPGDGAMNLERWLDLTGGPGRNEGRAELEASLRGAQAG